MKNKILTIWWIIASLLCIWVSGYKFFIEGGSYLHLFLFCVGFDGLFCSVGSLPNFKFSDMFLYYSRVDGLVCVRFFSRTGGGLKIKDIRKHPLLFSERNGYKKSFHIGSYYFFKISRIAFSLEKTGKNLPFPVLPMPTGYNNPEYIIGIDYGKDNSDYNSDFKFPERQQMASDIGFNNAIVIDVGKSAEEFVKRAEDLGKNSDSKLSERDRFDYESIIKDSSLGGEKIVSKVESFGGISDTSDISGDSELFIKDGVIYVRCKEYRHPTWSGSLILPVSEKDHDVVIRDLDSEVDLSLLRVTDRLLTGTEFENLPEWAG